jgi:hypothetical protein
MGFNTCSRRRSVARADSGRGTLLDTGNPHAGLVLHNPHLWLDLADQAFAAGRYEQLETLIAEAYAAFDRAVPPLACVTSESTEEESRYNSEWSGKRTNTTG